jgi:hypothetical protein
VHIIEVMNGRRSKVEEIDAKAEAYLLEHGERPARPAVRIRKDAPAIEVTATTPAVRVLDHLGDELDSTVVRDESGEAKAVVLTPERYAELATREVYDSKNEWLAKTRADRMEPEMKPPDSMLRGLMIEPADLGVEWR